MSKRLENENFFPIKSKHEFAIPLESEKKQSWLLTRIWKKPDDGLQKLSIKAHSIKPEAEEVHKDLMKILNHFSSNDSLYPYVKEAIDPLLREIDQILKKLQNNLTGDALDKYSEWTEKAGRWVHLCNKVNEENLIHVVIDRIIDRSLELIDRDIKLIFEYHTAQNPHSDVTSYIDELKGLQVRPEISLNQISKWKQDFDLKRQRIVNAAYQKIDSLT